MKVVVCHTVHFTQLSQDEFIKILFKHEFKISLFTIPIIGMYEFSKSNLWNNILVEIWDRNSIMWVKEDSVIGCLFLPVFMC
jgi:hypothetical protein